LPRIVEAGRTNEAEQLILKLLNILAWLSFFPFSIIALISGDIVPLIFGMQWAPAASVVAWTSVWVAWQFVASPLSTVMAGMEALRLHTGVQLLLFTLRVGAILVGVAVASPDVAIIAFTCASIAGYLIYLLAIGFVGGVKPTRILQAIAGPIALSAFCTVVIVGGGLSGIPKYAIIALFGVAWIARLQRIAPDNLRILKGARRKNSDVS
jgi:O-antigen/teichoic acid export membrane protein